jgi:DNA-directed RNA polymerase specialized sigma24 family protein
MTDHAARRAAAITELPTVHAKALRLHDAGQPPDRIASLLEIEPEAVGPLLAMATAKLEEILARNEASIASSCGAGMAARRPG